MRVGRKLGGTGLIAMVVLAGRAHAGESMDLEAIRPQVSAGGGVVVPEVPTVAGSWAVGVFGQYERNPLVLRADGQDLGSVVGNRARFDVQVAHAVTDRLALQAGVPVVAQWGSTVSELEGDGAGPGDAALGARYRFAENDTAVFGARADLVVPTGAGEAWFGERTARAELGVVARAGGDGGWFAGELGLVARSIVETEADLGLSLGPEALLALSGGVPVGEGTDLFAVASARAGLASFLTGAGETPLELLVGTRTAPGPVAIQLAVGRGLGGGYGASDVRALVGVTWTRVPEAPAPVVVAVEPEPELVDAPDIPIVEPPPQVVEIRWQADELARVVGEQIVIRDPIQFEVGTDRVLASSLPTLVQVAALVGVDRLLVIEGHSSEEGEHGDNYELSLRRARSIWEELVRAGIPPQRLAYRGMGEVAPVREGSSEEDLAANRRVVFYLLQLPPSAAPPESYKVPWSGDTMEPRP